VTQFAQRFRFDLPNSLPCHLKILADFFEGMVRFFADAEAHPQHLLFAWCQGVQNPRSLIGKVPLDHRFEGGNDTFVLDEIAEARILLFTDGSLQGDRLLGDFQNPADLLQW